MSVCAGRSIATQMIVQQERSPQPGSNAPLSVSRSLLGQVGAGQGDVESQPSLNLHQILHGHAPGKCVTDFNRQYVYIYIYFFFLHLKTLSVGNTVAVVLCFCNRVGKKLPENSEDLICAMSVVLEGKLNFVKKKGQH